MNAKLPIIIRREYLERVSKKSFIITTLVVPVVMVLLMLSPALIAFFHTPDVVTVAVIDHSGLVADTLESDESITFVTNVADADSAKNNSDYDCILIIGSNIVERPSSVSLFTRDAAPMMLEGRISSKIKQVVEAERLKSYDITNLPQILKEIEADVKLQTYRLDKEGNEETADSSEFSFLLGMAMCFMLYMFLLIYGQMVMTGIIEEKNNRVLEVIVSSVKPQTLMLGKIAGIGLVAVTQIVIWGIIIFLCSAVIMPMLVPTEMMAEASAMRAGGMAAGNSTFDPDMLAALGMAGDIGYLLYLLVCLIVFLVGGFLLYSAIYAAIGSAVDNIQDASQLQTIALIPIILAMVFATVVGTEPGSSLAFWLSMIPFTSPILMMIRIPFQVPVWEIILSAVILYASFMGMVWCAAKVYRVGIFMYGKKPTFADLVKWMRYK